ncbi:MAG TPA: transglutaminase domain-containing protein [Candidatus Limnocylindrales bacterium]|nr:transglutaminase domain-containing protein [Candidatus Limnocylindrales bacterium]
MPFTIVTDRRRAPDELKLLRTMGDDLSTAKDWQGLHALRQELRADHVFWAERWGPVCAIAAGHIGDYQTARELLREVIEAGFHQPDQLIEESEAAFDGDAELARLWACAADNRPAAPVILVDWPTITPGAPLSLFRLPPDGEDLLRGMIPEPSPSAWETARRLAVWVSSRWRHANVHMEVDDAVICLERVAAGARFACVEYTLVLSQALNALGIPARKISLAQDGYHAGVGRGHVVSEAWIDDLKRWVVLDGQNGLYWTDDDGTPLGLPELMELHRDGAAVTGYVKEGEPFTEEKARFWFSYFAHGVSTAGIGAAGGYVPIFQRNYVYATPRLEKDSGRLYPDLAEIAIGVHEIGGQLAIRFSAAHPFATGFEVSGFDGAGEPVEDGWVMDSTPGEHLVEVRTRTPYGLLAPQTLHYRVPSGG